MRCLHIYGQELWHDPAFIVGDRASLKSLAQAIELAISRESGAASAAAMTTDGEGYVIFVLAKDPVPSELVLPYNDHSIVTFEGKSPYDLLSRDEILGMHQNPDVDNG